MTLLQMSQGASRPLDKGVIATFAASSGPLRVLGFESAPGGAVQYSEEVQLPDVSFRAINGTYSPTTGAVNPKVEPTVIIGGEVIVDNYLVATKGTAAAEAQTRMQLKNIAASFTLKMFKGDGAVTPTELTGLQARLPTSGAQVISAGSTANGAALSLSDVLDAAIDQCFEPTTIFCSKATARKFSKAARDTAVGGNIVWTKDTFGDRIMQYNGLNIVPVAGADDADTILPFTEAAASGTATATSLYIAGMGPGKLTGIQVRPPEITPLGNSQGQMESRPARGFRLEWYPGIALYHGRAAVRVRHIGNLDFVK
jgi:hypothetical protein